MKFTSIIFIFISVILVFGGIFAMNYARNLAGDDLLIDGYSWTEDGQNQTSLSFDDEEIIKVALTLSDCDIIIEGGSEKSYIELNNFMPNAYICTTSSGALTVSDNVSLLDYLSFDGSGVKFAGVWQTLYSAYKSRSAKNDVERQVIIHIAKTEDLKQINLELSGCTLNMHDISGNGDIKISGSDTKVELSKISSSVLALEGDEMEYTLLGINTNRFTFESKSGVLTTSEVNAKTISMDAGEVEISLLKTDFTKLTATLKKGNIRIDTNYDMTNFARNIETQSGSIVIDGVNIGSSFATDKEAEYAGSIEIKVEEGSADISFGNLVIIPDTDEPENPEEGGDNNSDTEKE